MALLHTITATEFNNRTITHLEWQTEAENKVSIAAGFSDTNMMLTDRIPHFTTLKIICSNWGCQMSKIPNQINHVTVNHCDLD